MFVPVWFTHAWSTGEGDLLGAYLHCTATTPFETVCKQFINGSVPFGYSLNSGFDTGNDSWFSSGAWQVGTPVQKMPAGTGALWVGESRGPRGLGYHFLLGLALWGGGEKKIPLHSSKSWGRKRERSQDQGPQYSFFRRALSHAHINIQRQDLHGRVEQVISILVMPYSQLKGYHTDGLEQAPRFTKKRRHIIQPDYTIQLKAPLTKRQYRGYFSHLTAMNYVFAQTWPFSRRGIVSVRLDSWAGLAHPRHTQELNTVVQHLPTTDSLRIHTFVDTQSI